jgi:hypothetical protein
VANIEALSASWVHGITLLWMRHLHHAQRRAMRGERSAGRCTRPGRRDSGKCGPCAPQGTSCTSLGFHRDGRSTAR